MKAFYYKKILKTCKCYQFVNMYTLNDEYIMIALNY